MGCIAYLLVSGLLHACWNASTSFSHCKDMAQGIHVLPHPTPAWRNPVADDDLQMMCMLHQIYNREHTLDCYLSLRLQHTAAG